MSINNVIEYSPVLNDSNKAVFLTRLKDKRDNNYTMWYNIQNVRLHYKVDYTKKSNCVYLNSEDFLYFYIHRIMVLDFRDVYFGYLKASCTVTEGDKIYSSRIYLE